MSKESISKGAGWLRSAAIFAAGTLFAIAAMGESEIKLLNGEYDFGVIKEADGVQTGYARVVNLGSDETYIRELRPSCGCTGADFDKDVLAPGDTALISFSYDPKGRPGNFDKTVRVYFGQGDSRTVIHLKGRVLGTPETLSKNYPVECGRLRLSERVAETPAVKRGLGRHVFIRLMNQSMDTIHPVWENNYKALSIDVYPKDIAPGDIASLGIYLNSRFEDREGDELEYVIPIKAEGDEESVDIVLKAWFQSEPEDEESSENQ